jgi:hypothetical protein
VPPSDRSRTYAARLEIKPDQKTRVPVPFDPDEAWGTKRVHHVNGTVAGVRVRVTVTKDAAGWSFTLGPCRLVGVPPGDEVEVEVVIAPEGPQRGDLAPDIAAALEAEPAAGAFFDTLAQFYRKGYLRWIDGTTRRPDVRAERIAEMVRLLNDGVKERPRPRP